MRRLHRRHILQLRLRRARPCAASRGGQARALAPSLFSRCASPSAARGCGSPPLLSSRYSSPSTRRGSSRAPARYSRPSGFSYGAAVWGRGLRGHLLHLPRRLQGRRLDRRRAGRRDTCCARALPRSLRHAGGRLARLLGEALDDRPRAALGGAADTPALRPSPSPRGSPRAASASWDSRTSCSAL